MPDIDVDFCFEGRQEVIDYVRRKYGDDCVVQIVTFGTLAARGVIRDVGRVLDMPYAQVDTIAKMIPQELNITIDKALKMNPELKKAYEEQDEIHYLIDMAKRLEGLPRHTPCMLQVLLSVRRMYRNMYRFPEHRMVPLSHSLP